jgi:hypothetical protein
MVPISKVFSDLDEENPVLYYTYYDYKKPEVLVDSVMEKEKLEKVHEFFPFSRAPITSSLYCPTWAKEFLFRKYTLAHVPDMIKYFNKGGELALHPEHKHFWKVPTMLLEDLSLQAFTMNEIIDHKEKR